MVTLSVLQDLSRARGSLERKLTACDSPPLIDHDIEPSSLKLKLPFIYDEVLGCDRTGWVGRGESSTNKHFNLDVQLRLGR